SHSLNARLDEKLASEADTAASLFVDEYREMGEKADIAAREVVGDMKLHGDIVLVADREHILAASAPVVLSSLARPKRRIAERRVELAGVTYRVVIAASLESIGAELSLVRRAIAIGLPLTLALA